jgi:hypothetical protein
VRRRIHFINSPAKQGSIDLEAAKQHISIGTYLESMGVKCIYSCSKYSSYSAPYRRDSNASFFWYKEKNRWWDFGLCEGGSIIDIIKKMEDLSTGQAIDRLKSMV